MKWTKTLAVFTIFSIVFFSMSLAHAIPSGGTYPPEFTLKYGEWYDSWGFNRNYYGGNDGFLPNIAYESLGADRERAYNIGEWFKSNYAQKLERAEAILSYVQSWTDYGYDSDNVRMEGEYQEEWAWNADEMAHMFDETTLSTAVGDCEDMAFLCSTIYLAAGFDVALISPPSHVSLMIWLPEFDNANYYWDILNDGKESGWIWVEATGEENPLGWTPPDYTDGKFDSYLLGFSEFNVEFSPQNPQAEDDVLVEATVVSARGTVSQALLTYSIGNVNEMIPMQNDGSAFTGIIPKQAEGTQVNCNVSVLDTAGFTRAYTFEYSVGQEFEIPPYLLEAGAVFLIIVLIAVLLLRPKK